MDTVEMPQGMKVKAQNLLITKAQAEQRLNDYLAGCYDGLQLEGDWEIDMKTWSFRRKENGDMGKRKAKEVGKEE